MVPSSREAPRRSRVGLLLSKVPEVTVFFWIIKVLATTVGQSAADFLSDNLELGLTNTTYMIGAILIAALVFQFRSDCYVPGIYWLAVLLLSIVGTLITDNLVDNLRVSLVVSALVITGALAICFIVWFVSEGTLSIHAIRTRRREAFYWSTIMFTFALGAAAGDLLAENLAVGYWRAALICAGAIALVAAAHFATGLDAIVAFWVAYVLTRPLGASIGDYLSRRRADGGLGVGTVGTSVVFLATIILIVFYLAASKRDEVVVVP